ncbi:MAG: sec-independent protein translocase protein TatC [Oceanicoccus sp.]|jgi:sec-independent protein translocase protein TatC
MTLQSTYNDLIDHRQPLIIHLTELRNRLLYCVLAVGVFFSGLFFFANELYELISEPLRRHLPEGTSMIATDVAAPFLTPFKLSLVAALVLAMPFVFYQIWQFVKPGLRRSEQALAWPLLTSSIVLFYLGIAFAYFLVFPLVFGFFTQVGPSDVAVMTDISRYLDFVIKLFLAFGFAFEIPVVTFLLVLTGICTRQSLRHKRAYVFVSCFVVGMLLTPPDIISQFLLALPMWLLFEAGLWMTRWIRDDDDAAA